MAVRRVDDLQFSQVDPGGLGGLRDAVGGADQERDDQSVLERFDRGGKRRRFAWMSDRGRNRLEALASLEEAFVLSRSGQMGHLFLPGRLPSLCRAVSSPEVVADRSCSRD